VVVQKGGARAPLFCVCLGQSGGLSPTTDKINQPIQRLVKTGLQLSATGDKTAHSTLALPVPRSAHDGHPYDFVVENQTWHGRRCTSHRVHLHSSPSTTQEITMKHLNRTVLSLTLAAALSAAAAGSALAEPVAKAASPSFKDYDSNGDGKVSQEEFRALGGDEQAFRKADANRDNQLSSDEFTKASASENRT
jgi:hypothetical protein